MKNCVELPCVELVLVRCLYIDFVVSSYLLKNLRDGIKTKKFHVEKGVALHYLKQ